MSDEEKKQARRERKYNYHNTHYKYKNVPFSTTNENDMKILEYLGTQPNAAAYMKTATLMRMESEQDGPSIKLEAMTMQELMGLMKKVTEEIEKRTL